MNFGSPGDTFERHTMPYLLTSTKYDTPAPIAMTHMAIGNLGMSRLDTRSTTSAETPTTRLVTFISHAVSAICFTSSRSSPVPAPAPYSFGICISIIVVHIPDIKPPMTGVDM